jgi:hypothetical protein
VNYFNEKETRELLALKAKWGWSDPRLMPEMKDCDICANDTFRRTWMETGVAQRAFEPAPAMKPASGSPSVPAAGTPEQEELIRVITDRVLAALQK